MNGRHHCPGGCGAYVPDVMFACYDCWDVLPGPSKTAVSRTATLPLFEPRRALAVAGAMKFYLRRASRDEALTVPDEWAAVVSMVE
jgi:hypothetical protein